MLGTGSEAAQAIAVSGRTIALVLPETIVRVDGIKASHHMIPMHLGDDGSGADCRDLRVTANNRVAIQFNP